MNSVLTVPGLHKKRRLTLVPEGSAPGTFVVDPDAPAPEIRVMAYGPDRLVDVDVLSVAEIRRYLDEYPVTWVDVHGLGDAATIQQLGDLFAIHTLALEDVFNVRQRPKLEEYPDQIFVTTRIAMLGEQFEHEQISLFLGPNYVLTFHQYTGDRFEPVRERLRQRFGLFRTCGPDYLAYAILDAVVDGYFPVLEEYGERLEALEDEIITHPQRDTILTVQAIRRGILSLRRSIWPQREFLNALLRDGSPLITEQTRLHLRDAYDHTVRIMDFVDTYRDISAGLTELYMSSVSHRMNDVMKVLTVIATIFIPLSFVTGVYGMNFNPDASPWSMPELSWYWAYPMFWVVIVAIAAALLTFFRRRGWIGSKSGVDG